LAHLTEVYGDPLCCPQPESYWGNVNSFGPRACYDEGKRVAEALAYAYRLQHKTSIRIVRIFNAFGPGLRPDDGRVVSNFITAALQGKDLTVTGDGKSSRCFQFVSDCVRGMELLMNSAYEGPCNIGSDRETSIGELATMISERVARKTGREPVGVVFNAKVEDDPFRRQPDISVAKRELGWSPTVSLEDGLDQSIDWYMNLEAEMGKGNCVVTNDVNGHKY
jgi:UDP-glucuronate decarboxylase